MADRPNILGRFWRGDCSLALSFWGFYIGLTIIVQWAFPAARPLIEGRTFDPFRIFAYVMAGFVLLSTIGIYQWVGLWRATSHTIARRRADGRHSIAGWTVRVIIVVAIANFGRLLVVTVVPSAREFYEIAFRGDPSIPPFAMRATPDGTQLLVFGGFKYGLTTRFLEQADKLPELRTVHLASPGGRIGEAMHFSRELRTRGLDTYVSDICFSACTVAFAGGRKRWILGSGKLGYHGESFLGAAIADHGGADSESAALLAAGLPRAFVDKAVATPPRELWKPTLAELREAKAITDVAGPGRFAASALGMDPSVSRVAAVLEKSPMPAALAIGHADRFHALAVAVHSAYLAGHSQEDLRDLNIKAMDAAFAAALPTVDDATLAAYGALIADEYQAMLAVGPAQCYAYFNGKASDMSLRAELGPDLIARDDAMKLRVIAAVPAGPATERDSEASQKAFAEKLVAAVTPAELATLEKPANDDKARASACRSVIAMIRTAVALPPAQAGAVLRDILAAK